MNILDVGKDLIAQKKRQLDRYNSQADSAVRIINSTAYKLECVVNKIDETIGEIDEYQAQLEDTKNNLCETRERNKRIIHNFEALLN